MRYRIAFQNKEQEPVEVECVDLRIVGPRKVKAVGDLHPAEMLVLTPTITLSFGSVISRISDDHDRAIYEAC